MKKINFFVPYLTLAECHYFLEDSMFNTYTQLSYDWIMGKQFDATLIFVSATIERIRDYILKDNQISETEEEEDFRGGVRIMRGHLELRDRVRDYGIKADYAYVNVSLLKKVDEITELVEKDRSKWLIFVDSIEKGGTIEKAMRRKGIDSVFITAESKKDRELSGTVQQVRTREKYEQRVLIATSVMDNGISIKDFDLRKLIIMAVTKEQFMQMLGRKRRGLDTEKLEVYLLLREKEYFRKLLVECEKRQRFISEAEKNNFEVDINLVLEKILESNVFYQCAKNFCYVSQGMVAFSKLAIAQCDYLCRYYKRMVEKFEKEGGIAFFREQLEWLGHENVEEIIKLTKTLLDRICEIIDEYKGKDLSREDNDEMREKIRNYICQALECYEHNESSSEDIKKLIKEFKKKSKNEPRPISEGNFNKTMQILNLGYQMTKSNRSLFLISDKDLGQESEQEKEKDKNLSEE